MNAIATIHALGKETPFSLLMAGSGPSSPLSSSWLLVVLLELEIMASSLWLLAVTASCNSWRREMDIVTPIQIIQRERVQPNNRWEIPCFKKLIDAVVNHPTSFSMHALIPRHRAFYFCFYLRLFFFFKRHKHCFTAKTNSSNRCFISVCSRF